jgi:hypothetical protein
MSLPSSVPLLLLPIRIETRFVAIPQPNVDVSAGTLFVRAYPDTISTSSFEPELTADEIAAGTAYWQHVWTSHDTLAAWRVLAGAYTAPRAAWIVQAMTPTNLAARPATPPQFPTPPTRASSYERAPTAEALPDAWVVVLKGGGNTRTVQGNPIATNLAVGLTPHDGTFPDGLPVDAGMRWLVDFADAEKAGMGIRIPLTPAETSSGFDRVLVFGLRDAAADVPGEQAFARLLTDHHHTDGFALVPQGAPTNNTTDASSAFSTSDPDHAISFSVELGPDFAADDASDGALLTAALGLPAGTCSHVRFADGHGVRNGRDMLTALWPATLGYFVSQMMDPAFTAAEEDAMRAFAIASVVPRGPLPAIRVGATPYGVLPTTSLAAEARTRRRSAVAQLARLLLPAWEASWPAAPHLDAGGDPDQELLSVLSMDASSVNFRGRRVLGDDALWNVLAFLDPEGLTDEWWAEHAARGRALLDGLGLTNWDPRVIHTAIGRDSYSVPYPTVQDAPLSETEPLAADATLDGHRVNYIEWLAHAPMNDVWADNYPGPLPTAVLYRVLRQSMLREYVTQAGRAQVSSGVLAASALREVELVNMQPTAPTVTGRAIVDRPVAVGSKVTWAQYLDTAKATPETPLARLGDLRASLDRLAQLPTAEIDRLLTETLDAASHRLDVWVTAVSTSLLAAGETKGMHLGAYGWVENLRPAPSPPVVTGIDAVAVARLDRARARVAGNVAPRTARLPHTDNGGFVQAPSLTQAAAGAVLRSGYLSHRGTPDEPLLAIDLSSQRTSDALWLLDGVRQGLSLGALTGYRFEQQLHELGLDVFVQPFRDAYPLVGDELTGATANGAVLSPPQVADGVKLRAAWQSGALTVGASWGAGLPTAAADQTAVVGVLQAIDDMLDGLSGVSIAESVFQIMRGNYARVGGILDAVSRGDHPPDPEIVVTPRPGIDLTHRLMLLLAGEPPDPPAWSSVTVGPRAVLEPWLSRWVGGRLHDPSTVRAAVTWTAGQAVVTLRDLNIGPLDVLALADASDEPQRAELEDRVLLAADPPADATEVTITYSAASLPAGSVTFPDLLTAARALRDLIGSARPLDLVAFAMPDKAPTSGSIDIPELTGRVSALVGSLEAVITALQNAADAAALTTALIDAAGFGVPGAVPAPDAGDAVLAAQAQRVLGQLQGRRAAVVPSPSTLAELQANAAAVLGAAAVVLPHVTPPDEASVRAAFAQSAAMRAVDPQAIRRWLLQLSHVRPAARRLDTAIAVSRLLGAAQQPIELAQLPLTANDRWLGLPLEAGNPPAFGRVAIEASCVGDPSAATLYAGLLLDEWLERIPGNATTAGVAFHYDEPKARAPQAMLLAVCPDERQTWDVQLVQQVLDETFDLAKVRAVDLASIAEVGQILPALFFPFNLEAATPATFFSEAASVEHVRLQNLP